ncbi:WXG100 family type VII secretion target [Nocardia cyriacigeorgica]|uniref:WXG100 family type VII secretion target n=1 Tax=Nocardia cyriacigeorgica TaxID=135487 RepID=UPI001894609F|nr:WXG100 family type VII secretion target [Nocardia cyriacigeorgica]MBF6087061.1 WXG100 family type VII secretion target [Nocardia cyriacigeorgica]MBF6319841.1 WXG100 family type VII secretion target [Nocardia cyriacigeorgica]MBF6533538.1 WXG100 family type VII secretion target [Nocardia cyriacigeorgica]
MSKVTTSEAAMTAAVNHIETVGSQLESEISNVRNLVQGIKESWQGQAQGSFDRVMLDFDDAQRKMNEALKGFSDSITSAKVGYIESEQRNQDALLQAGASGDLGDGLGLNSSLKI